MPERKNRYDFMQVFFSWDVLLAATTKSEKVKQAGENLNGKW